MDGTIVGVAEGEEMVVTAARGKEVAQNTISRISLSSLRIASVLAATMYDDGTASMIVDRLLILALTVAIC